MDPQSRNAIFENVRSLSKTGMAVLYTTHYTEEAERLCDRVGIIDHGRLIAEGTRRELVSLVGERDRISLGATGDLAAPASGLTALRSVHTASAAADGIDLVTDDARGHLPEILQAAATGATINTVEVTEPDLEIFSPAMKHVPHVTPHGMGQRRLRQTCRPRASITDLGVQLGVLGAFAGALLALSTGRLRHVRFA